LISSSGVVYASLNLLWGYVKILIKLG